MKNCPTCGSSYTDDTLVFCLQDGATLQSSAATNPLSLVATLRGDSQQSEEVTKDRNASAAVTAAIPASALPTAVYQEPRPTSDHASPAAPKPPANTARTVIITVTVTVLLMAIGGIGAWLFFRGGGDGLGRERRAAQANSTNATSNGTANTARGPQSNGQAGGGDGSGDKGGRWFVVLASFPKAEVGRATERMEALRKRGIDARVLPSDDYPNFKSGLWVIVMGPYTRNNAEEILEQVRPKVRDAYTKSGW